MTVEKHGRLAGLLKRFGEHQRMKLRRNDFYLRETGLPQPLGDPLRGTLYVLLLLALGADAGNAQELLQLIQVFIAMALDVFEKTHAGYHRPLQADWLHTLFCILAFSHSGTGIVRIRYTSGKGKEEGMNRYCKEQKIDFPSSSGAR